ncbi:unnamed protein product [Microthlaspi erraticum]|uniref:Uncharacterized protein n=1 Tax=Microthlaspi erraticum TaxID=1685480 RepID=A0A6D2I3U0_9BRAS|nr:unnamed protein product [Microthlaspi erraticum]
MEQKESNHQVPKSRAPKSTFLAKDQTGASEVQPHVQGRPVAKAVNLVGPALRMFMPSRRPKVMILIWKDRYLSCDPRRSGKRSFGSFIWPELIFYQDMSGKRLSRAHGDFNGSRGLGYCAQGLGSSLH